VLSLPQFLALKAEALHLANRTFEALQSTNEAKAVAERFEQRWYLSELHRLRGVFLAAIGTNETEIETSFLTAIRTAQEQKSFSLAKRSDVSYKEYLRQKRGTSDGRGFRLPLW
jgi:hypothetical protein